MARLGDATWHLKSVNLALKEWLIISHVWEMNPMVHNEPHESMMS